MILARRLSLLLAFLLTLPTIGIAPASASVTVSTFAGFGGAGGTDGGPGQAKFNRPKDIAIKDGFTYVLDGNGIRQINANGAVSTIYRWGSSSAGQSYCSLNIDKKDVLWIVSCNGSQVWRFSKSGQMLNMITIANNLGWILTPHSAAFLPDGRLLVPVWSQGRIVAVAEDGSTSSYFTNSPEASCGGASTTQTRATYCPSSLTVSSSGQVYFASQGTARGIYRVNSQTSASLVDSTYSVQGFRSANGNVFFSTITGTGQSKRVTIYRMDSSQIITQYANFPNSARWLQSGFDIDSSGNIYHPDEERHIVLQLRQGGQLIQKFGNGGYGVVDGDKSIATFDRPVSSVEATNGDIYVKETGAIRKISTSGQVSTIYRSDSLTTDFPLLLRNDRLYFIDSSNYFLSIDLNGANYRSEFLVTVRPEYLYGGNNYSFDSKGNLYVLYVKGTGEYSMALRRFSPTGERRELSSVEIKTGQSAYIYIDPQDNIWIAQSSFIRKYDTNGTALNSGGVSSYFGTEPMISADQGKPTYIFSGDTRTFTFVKFESNLQDVLVSGASGESENRGDSSSFYGAKSMIRLKNGDFLVADTDNNILRKIVITQSTSTPNKWQPRAASAVPAPTGLSAGLVQTTFNSYFDDQLSLFTSPPKDSKIVDNIPTWFDYDRPSSSYEWTGYFIPDYTGTWTFRLTSDDASYLWIGKNAVTSFRSNPRSGVATLPGQHVELTATGTIALVKDQVYPIRINYGNWENTLASFKLEHKAPGFDSYETNFRSLIWHSAPGSCTNWGIDYLLVNELNIDQVSIPTGCVRNVTTTPSPGNSNGTKPTTPTFTGVNFTGNKINIDVNIGASPAARPEKIYLVAPKLGITSANPLAGVISGGNAKWSLDFDKLLAGTMIPLEIVGEKDGVKSDTLSGSYQAPTQITSVTSVPPAPSKFKSRIVGSSAVITAQTQLKAGALATKAYLFGKSLGISKSKAIEGDVVGNKVILEVPVKSSMSGKRYPITIYLTNEKGESKPLNATLAIPKAPSTPALPTAIPQPPKMETVICQRASQTRAFSGRQCPPGWEERN